MSRNSGYVSGFRYERRVERFTADGTFTPPAGVTYAIAHIRGAGGGVGGGGGGAGGTSSVAFASGTISANGGTANNMGLAGSFTAAAGPTNSGQGGMYRSNDNADPGSNMIIKAHDGTYIVAGGLVTAGTGITVTVGAGGTAGTSGAAGGSGYVWIEFEQPVGAGL